MKKLPLVLMLFFSVQLHAQNTTTLPSSGAPSSSACTFNLFVNDTTNGNLYFCKSGVLTIISSSSSSGASLSANNIFTGNNTFNNIITGSITGNSVTSNSLVLPTSSSTAGIFTN